MNEVDANWYDVLNWMPVLITFPNIIFLFHLFSSFSYVLLLTIFNYAEGGLSRLFFESFHSYIHHRCQVDTYYLCK